MQSTAAAGKRSCEVVVQVAIESAKRQRIRGKTTAPQVRPAVQQADLESSKRQLVLVADIDAYPQSVCSRSPEATPSRSRSVDLAFLEKVKRAMSSPVAKEVSSKLAVVPGSPGQSSASTSAPPSPAASVVSSCSLSTESAVTSPVMSSPFKESRQNELPPESIIIGRDKERSELESFFESCFSEATARRVPKSLYISGGPGTGKTSSVRSVVRQLVQRKPEIHYIEVNCMTLTQRTLPALFARIASFCGGAETKRALSSHSGLGMLHALRAQLAALGVPVVLVLDEVDQMVRKGGAKTPMESCPLDIVFSLPVGFGAPNLAIVAIANAVDLLQRPASATAERLAGSLLFKPYSADELRVIFQAKMATSDHGADAERALGKLGVELRVRQVAKESGDCRQLLSLCQHAIFEADAMATAASLEVATTHPAISRAVPKTKSDALESVDQLPMEHQVLLCALASAPTEAVLLSKVCSRYRELCHRLHQPMDVAFKGHIVAALAALSQRGLLTTRPGRKILGAAVGEMVVELAVSRKALRDSVAKANKQLEACLQ